MSVAVDESGLLCLPTWRPSSRPRLGARAQGQRLGPESATGARPDGARQRLRAHEKNLMRAASSSWVGPQEARDLASARREEGAAELPPDLGDPGRDLVSPRRWAGRRASPPGVRRSSARRLPREAHLSPSTRTASRTMPRSVVVEGRVAISSRSGARGPSTPSRSSPSTGRRSSNHDARRPLRTTPGPTRADGGRSSRSRRRFSFQPLGARQGSAQARQPLYPDRVVPMLPRRSAPICSLKKAMTRGLVCTSMCPEGHLRSWRFTIPCPDAATSLIYEDARRRIDARRGERIHLASATFSLHSQGGSRSSPPLSTRADTRPERPGPLAGASSPRGRKGRRSTRPAERQVARREGADPSWRSRASRLA